MPPNPTVILAGYKGERLLVVNASGDSAQVVESGKLVSVGTDASFSFGRARRFAEGSIQILTQNGVSSIKQYTAGGSGADLGVHYSAQLRSDRARQDCYLALVVYDPNFRGGRTDIEIATCFFKKIADLSAGTSEFVSIDIDSDRLPNGLAVGKGFSLLVFTKGLEIRNPSQDIATAFFRRLELVEHKNDLARYLTTNFSGDQPLKPYLVIPPILPDDVNSGAYPSAIDVRLAVNSDGTISNIELPDRLPPAIGLAVKCTLNSWLFLPRIESGEPRATTLRTSIPLGGKGQEVPLT